MTEETATEKRVKKVNKDLTSNPGELIIEVIDGEKGPMKFNPGDLPAEIQAKLPAMALSHKLGDSVGTRKGPEAEEAITRVWEAMMSGDMTTRQPAKPKVAVADIKDRYANLSEDEKAAAAILLKSLGIKI